MALCCWGGAKSSVFTPVVYYRKTKTKRCTGNCHLMLLLIYLLLCIWMALEMLHILCSYGKYHLAKVTNIVNSWWFPGLILMLSYSFAQERRHFGSPWYLDWYGWHGMADQQWSTISLVYTIQPVVKPVWQPVVSCIQTFNRLSNTTRLTSGLTNGQQSSVH